MSDQKPLKWKDLDGAQKYEVVELARKPGTSVTDLCKTFGVSRQTLYRAMDLADKAACDALTPKRRGRPSIPRHQKDVADLQARNKRLESDLKQERLKNQVALAMLELHRKADRQQRIAKGKKKRDANSPKPPSGTDEKGPGS